MTNNLYNIRMKNLYRYSCGEGKLDFVMLHGWGMNSNAWRYIINRFGSHFRLHLFDLPGYGLSQSEESFTLPEISETVLKKAPPQAIWPGWSMGGCIASEIALRYPERVLALITVCSSPCFVSQHQWPRISWQVLSSFEQKLEDHLQNTLEQFLLLQTLGTLNSQRDTTSLKSFLFSRPLPKKEVLKAGLKILRYTDMRDSLNAISVPFLRIYGKLDALVPSKIAELLDEAWPNTESVIMHQSAHVPFISHTDDFLEVILYFYQKYFSH